MKRTLSLIMALAMVLGLLVVPSFAAATDFNEDGTPKTFAGFAETYGYEADSGDYIDTKADIVIDFDLELIYWGTKPTDETTLPTWFTTDGTKWSQMKFSIADSAAEAKEAGTQKEFQKILDKGADNLQFTSAYDTKNKEPQKAVKDTGTTAEPNNDAIAAATTYKWGKIDARPKLDGFKPEYATKSKLSADYDFDTAPYGRWTLENTKGTQKMVNLQVAYSTDGKNPAGDAEVAGDAKYGVFGANATDGVPVVKGSKAGEKVPYLIRVAPTKKSAASKAKKLTVSAATKAPNLKIDYKKAIVKFKADMIFGNVDLLTADQVEKGASTGSSTVTEDNPIVPTAIGEFYNQTIKTIAKGATETKDGLPIGVDSTKIAAGKMLEYGADYGIQTWATAKKPASLVQPLSIADVGTPYEVDAGLTIKGINVKLPKTYEAYDSVKKKWGNSLKAEKSGIYEVRLKNTAKYDAKTNVTSGSPASNSMFLGVVVGKDAKDKAAVTASSYMASNGKADAAEILTASGATHAVYPAALADINKSAAIKKDTAAAGVTVEPATVVVAPGTGAKTITGAAEGTIATNLTFTDAQASSKFTIVALPALTEAATVTVTYACADYDKFYAPTFTVFISVDNKGILGDKKTAVEAVTELSKEYTTAALKADLAATKAAAKSAVETALGDFKTGSNVTVDVEITKEAASAVAGAYKMTVTIERGDASITVTKTGIITALA